MRWRRRRLAKRRKKVAQGVGWRHYIAFHEPGNMGWIICRHDTEAACDAHMKTTSSAIPLGYS